MSRFEKYRNSNRKLLIDGDAFENRKPSIVRMFFRNRNMSLLLNAFDKRRLLMVIAL